MTQLDELLETQPTEKLVAEMADTRLRNLQCFAELQSFNDTGKFLCKHPLLEGRSEAAQLRTLLRREPSEFLRRHKNVLDNIKRYKSYLKRDDRLQQRTADREHLQRFKKKEELFRLILSERER